MKLEDLAYLIAGEALRQLETKYHYRVPEAHKKEVQTAVRDNLNHVMAKARSPESGE
jgi:hypothetical protein